MFMIDPPPPTVSGKLHMGHIFSYVQMDFLARFQKLKGEQLVYPFCYDNNGLPTEKLAREVGINDIGAICFHSELESLEYQSLFQKMGMDFDYNNIYSTYSTVADDLAKQSFYDLFNKGYIYKAEKEVFWCPVTQCPVSQSEIDSEGRYERSGAKAEKKVVKSWFVDVVHYLGQIRDMVNKIEWHPDYYRIRLLKWLDEYKYDWCISRQRRYGIKIPDDCDVFDTWFISSLTPQLAWSTKTGKPSLKCPTFDARFQAHDIIYTWALYTIIKSLYHNKHIPWRKIIISGHALTGEGGKMSKSKGKHMPPLEMIVGYGADAIRYWAAQSQPGSDTKVDYDTMAKGRRLLSKIKNAKRYLELNHNDGENESFRADWLRVRGQLDVDLGVDYNWANALSHLTKFFWASFCDQYIEAAKKTPSCRTLEGIFEEMLDYFEIFLPNIREVCRG